MDVSFHPARTVSTGQHAARKTRSVVDPALPSDPQTPFQRQTSWRIVSTAQTAAGARSSSSTCRNEGMTPKIPSLGADKSPPPLRGETGAITPSRDRAMSRSADTLTGFHVAAVLILRNGAHRRSADMKNVLLIALATGLPIASTAIPGQSLPPIFDSFLADEVHATAADRAVLLADQPLVKLLDTDPNKEIAVFGAIWVNAPAAVYVEQVKNIEQFEHGGAFRNTKRISDPPRSDDFSALSLTDDDFNKLKNCTEGDCSLRVDSQGLQALRAAAESGTPSARAEANAIIRRLALEYVNGYREGGNARLAVYRDKQRPTFVADEFRGMVERLPRLAADLPEMKRYLLDYPKATLPGATDFLYWQETKFGLKPTIRINHLVIEERPGRTVVASKMLYANHYFWTALELRVLLADPARGPGFWFVTVNRSRSDGLGGVTGRVIRGRVRSEVENGMRTALTATKAKVEAVHR
jgi:hypothetical protein